MDLEAGLLKVQRLLLLLSYRLLEVHRVRRRHYKLTLLISEAESLQL